MEYIFRKATMAELDGIMEIIEGAKRQMAREGKDQWDDTYPARQHIEADISSGNAYVMLGDGHLAAYGAVVFTGEPAYASIRGRWLTTGQPYVELHRLAVAQSHAGQGVGRRFMQAVEQLSRSAGVHSFRVDTNHDNARMQRLLATQGFTRCGDIYFQQGYRQAYEKTL